MTILIKKKKKPTSEMTVSETKPGRDRSRLSDDMQAQSSTLSE